MCGGGGVVNAFLKHMCTFLSRNVFGKFLYVNVIGGCEHFLNHNTYFSVSSTELKFNMQKVDAARLACWRTLNREPRV